MAVDREPPRRKPDRTKPLSPAAKREMIRALRRDGFTERAIAEAFGLSQPRIAQVCAAKD